MELIRGPSNLRDHHRGSVVTIGTFDGLHLGHQALLRRLKAHADALSRPAMVLTFEPMPREYLKPEAPPARLTSWRERWHILCRSGLDSMCVLRFDEGLRTLSGEGFAALLAQQLHARLVVVGHDFRFGRNGEATASMLVAAGGKLGFEVDVVPPVLLDGTRVSSSGVREALARGDFAKARVWLGRPYSMSGRVVRGNQLGRELGYPTANLRTGRRRVPVAGIFAVRVHGVTGEPLPGVASLGTRPTVAGGGEMLLEAHLFDFAGDLYGREIGVEFVTKLRDEERFADLDALVEQMHRDSSEARRILASGS
ncbi:MAG TPA: bifunctional riboflavin kinase/FAD synthetase [Steroidobacteraceae bacterium]|nr:bifunctional riboflavin kinase/FAD synthetase [Steroidobacteraceae bacterium]